MAVVFDEVVGEVEPAGPDHATKPAPGAGPVIEEEERQRQLRRIAERNQWRQERLRAD